MDERGREAGLLRGSLHGLPNTRDLGGYATSAGRVVRPGCLIRSGALGSMTEEDRKILLDGCRLQMVIDLRTGLEARQKPDPPLPGVRMVFHPVLDEETAGFTHEDEDGDMLDGFTRHARSLGGQPKRYISGLYWNLVLNRQAMERYGSFLRMLSESDPEKGALLWHCSAGKDRAGIAAAFVLSALGVPRETVLEDYALTNEYLEEETRRTVESVRQMGGDDGLLSCVRILCQVDRSYLMEAFDAIDSAFGTMEDYLDAGLGVGQAVREQLKARYLV